MTEVLIVLLGLILNGIGIMGCIVPGIPGPLVSFSSLLLFFLIPGMEVGTFALIIWGLFAVAGSAVDMVVPVLGAKKFGSSREGIIGGSLGIIVGLFFFPPFGIILGPLVGTIVGDMIAGGNFKKALNSGMGSLLGFLVGTTMKLIYCVAVLMFFFGKAGYTIYELVAGYV